MIPWLEKLTSLGQKTKNGIRAIGPILMSQSDKASEAFQRHLGRVAEVEAFRDLLKSEVEIRATIRRTLLDNYIRASDSERVRIEGDLEFLDGKIRALNVISKSLSYGPLQQLPSPPGETPKPIEGHWLDRFSELARLRNEDWRDELLARAFAQEAAEPGSVSPRALWLIGNMERPLFEALSSLLDICVWVIPKGRPFLPESRGDVFAISPDSSNSKITVGHLTFRLGDIGVIADLSTSSLRFPAGEPVAIGYDQKAYVIVPKKDLQVSGVLFTPLGESIARFYEPQSNPVGLAMLDNWTGGLTPEVADVTEARIGRVNEVVA
jgi:hypothetical protein